MLWRNHLTYHNFLQLIFLLVFFIFNFTATPMSSSMAPSLSALARIYIF